MHYNWQLLRAGSIRLDGGGMFGLIPKPLWSKLTPADDQNRIGLQTNCLLLEAASTPTLPHTAGEGARRILIETGYGAKWTDKERAIFGLEHRTIVDALREANVDPESIDMVIVTHLHFDHAGGLTHLDDGNEPVSTFSNARIVVQRREWEDALANKSTMTRTYLRSHLDPVADQVDLIDGEAEVAPGITVWPMVGHTWGQQAVRFVDAEGMVCFPGDVMPTIHHVGAPFSMGYDMLPYDNMLNKAELLEQADEGGWRIVLDHEPGDPVVRVVRDPERPERFVLETIG